MKRLYTSVIVVVIFSSWLNVVSAQFINIPDPNLAAAIQEELDLASDASITAGDLRRLITLEAIEQQITDLTGLENASRLENVDLSYNHINDLSPLSGLTQLKTLNLNFNEIRDMRPLSGLRRLETLLLSNNEIQAIWPPTVLTQLKTLNLNFNEIRAVWPLTVLTGLERLELWGNQISDVSSLASLIQLEYLDLDENLISDVSPLSGLTQLKVLALNHNHIRDISPLTLLHQLERLELWGNQISDVSPLSGLTELEVLIFPENGILDVSPLSGLTQLEVLMLSRNQIVDVSPLSGLTQLEELALGRNQIVDVSPLSDLTQLEGLSLNGNQIVDVSPLSDLTQLTRLWLNDNQIRDVGSLSDLTQLEGVSLNGNQIIDVSSLAGATQLKWLRLAENRIRDVSPLTNLVNLIELRLDGNPITDTSLLEVFVRHIPNFQIDIDIRISKPANVLIYTGFTSWIDRNDAIAEAETTRNLLQSAGIDAEITENENYVKHWMLQTTSDGAVDVLITYGVLPRTIYALQNAMPDGSVAENWIETTDGNTLLNHADYLGYWSVIADGDNQLDYVANGFNALQNLIDIPNSVIPPGTVNDNSPMSVTTDGSTLTPSLANFESDRPILLDQLEGDWYPEKILASDTGDIQATLADPVLLRDGDLGRIAIVHQTWFADNPKGKVAAELIINYLLADPVRLAADINEDGRMNIQDLVFVASNLGGTGENPADVNADGIVDVRDLIEVAGALDTPAAAPALDPQAPSLFTAADVRKWLSEAQHLNLTDPTSQRGIRFLEQLLTTLIPKETALLPNYPNPFNPETWIPYELSEPANVTLTIYAANGQIVRQLPLGHQSAGTYQSRARAVYWDGRNAVGEPVASGVYFYTLAAGDFTATRKMLIRK